MWNLYLFVSVALFTLLVRSDNGYPCQVNNCQQCSYFNYCGLCSNNYILAIDPITSQPYCDSVQCTDTNCKTCLADNMCQQCSSGYYITESGTCMLITAAQQDQISCGNDCLNCASSSQCNVCSYGFNIQNGYCAKNVPTYSTPNCLIAFYPGICQICQQGYIVSVGYQCNYANNVTCQVNNCMQCMNSDVCTTCLPNFILLDNGTCSSLECSVQNCQACSSSNTTACSQCQNNYYLNQTTNQCLLKSYGCNIPWCVACIGGDLCGECMPGYVLNSIYNQGTIWYAYCQQITQDNQNIPEMATKYCNKFGKFLSNADSGLAYGCISCWQGFVNVGGYCVANLNIDNYQCNITNCVYCIANNYCGQCAQGYYTEKFIGGKCMKMYSPLPNCLVNNGLNCRLCMQGYALNTMQNACQKINTQIQCMLTGCDYCLTNNQCSQCLPGYQQTQQLVEQQQNLQLILLTLDDGTDDNSSNCSNCTTHMVCSKICSIDNCYQCSTSSLCYFCTQDYILSSDKSSCILRSSQILPTQQCGQYGQFCTSCNAQACTQCTSNNVLNIYGGCCLKSAHNSAGCMQYQSECQQTCQICMMGYAMIVGTCYRIPCDIANCVYCFRSQICIVCSDGYQLNDEMICQQYSITDQNCSMIQGCTGCDTNGTCTSCLSGYQLYMGYCVCQFQNCMSCMGNQLCTECAFPTIPTLILNNGGCTPVVMPGTLCDIKNCFQCVVQNQCGMCNPGYWLSNGACVINNCSADSNCQLCSQSGDFCFLCNTGYIQSELFGPSCTDVSSSSPGNSQYTCQVMSCSVCETSTTCSVCYQTHQLSASKECIQKKCTNNCLICIGNDQCLVCDPSYYLTTDYTCQLNVGAQAINNTCHMDNCFACEIVSQINNVTNQPQNVNYCVNCGFGFQQSSDRQSCVPQNCIVPYCQICVDSIFCLVCQQGYFMNSYLQCVMLTPALPTSQCSIYNCLYCDQNSHCAMCLNGWNATDGLCQTNLYCDVQNCMSCTNNNNCTMCSQTYVLTSPQDTSNGNDGFSCAPNCDISSCQVCQTFSTCLTCVETYILSSDKASCACPDTTYTTSSKGLCVCPEGKKQFNNETCYTCDIQYCLQCSDVNQCANCTDTFNLTNNLCTCSSPFAIIQNICQCPAGTTQFEGNCFTCNISNCALCQSNNVCHQCATSYTLSDDNACGCTGNTTQFESYCYECNSQVVPYCDICSQNNSCFNCSDTFSVSSGQCVCPTLTTLYQQKCVTCNISNCKLCQQVNVCSSCLAQYTPNNNLCIQCKISSCLFCSSNSYCGSCKNGLEISSNGNKCITCSNNNCAQCSDTGVCAECDEGFQFDTDGQFCVQCAEVQGCDVCENQGTCGKCVNGYTLTVDGKCQVCEYPCQTCNDNGTCKTCQQPYSSLASSNGNCFYCTITNCLTCSSSSKSICTTCASGYRLLTSGTCQRKCATNLCTLCTDPGVCTKCIAGYSPSGSTCKQCTNAPACSQCSKNNVSLCLSCGSGYYLVDGACLACPSSNCAQCNAVTCLVFKETTGQFALTINNQIVPAICDPGCKKCSTNNPQVCINCYQGYSKTSSGFCRPCTYPCQTCKNSQPSTCLSCFGTSFLRNNACVTCTNSSNCLTCLSSNLAQCISCPNGFSLASNNTCVAGCPNNCLSCSNSSVCTVCVQGYSSNSEGVCLPCLANCRGCSGQANGVCISCGTGFYLNDNQVCVACSNFCQTCSTIGCTTCLTGYTLTNDYKCASNCVPPCASCSITSPTVCQTCIAGYQFDSTTSKCIPTISCTGGVCSVCPLGYILSGGVCSKCQGTSCARCASSSATTCASCVLGYYLSNSQQCTLCPTGCSSCTSTLTCQSCSSGYTMPQQTVTRQSVCVKCQSPCAQCQDNANTCTQCVSSYTLNGWKCLSSFNYGFNAVFSVDLDQFYENYQSLLQSIVNAIGSSNVNIITMIVIKQGSSIVTGNVTTNDAQGSSSSQSQITALNNLFSVNSNLAGMNVQSSDIVVNGGSGDDDDGSGGSSVNLGLILGICIPVGIIIIAILCYCICFRKGSSPPSNYANEDSTARNVRQQFELNQMENTV